MSRGREVRWREYGLDVYQDGKKIASVDTLGNGYFVRAIADGRIVVSTNIEKWNSKPTEVRRFIYLQDGSADVVTYGEGKEPVESFNTKEVAGELRE